MLLPFTRYILIRPINPKFLNHHLISLSTAIVKLLSSLAFLIITPFLAQFVENKIKQQQRKKRTQRTQKQKVLAKLHTKAWHALHNLAQPAKKNLATPQTTIQVTNKSKALATTHCG
jgi:hypothetical protein